MISNVDEKENLERMQRGELYYAFSPDLVAARKRCARIVSRLNNAGELSRREIAQFWREITSDTAPLPAPTSSPPTEESEDAVFHAYPWIERPITIDYGTNIKVGSNVFINFNCTFLDTCLVSIGSRTLIGPNVSFYSGTHPLDPYLRNGTNGPELGKPITVGEDCWIAGNVTILPGVSIGEGCTVGAGSVVTKDVPPFHVVAGNPARIIRKIEPTSRPQEQIQAEGMSGPENAMPEMAERLQSSES